MGTDLPEGSIWPKIRAKAISCGAEVLDADPIAAATPSLMAHRDPAVQAVVSHTGGLLIDNGWLRVLGSGAADQGLIGLAEANAGALGVHPEGLLVGYDVLGGLFCLVGEGQRKPLTVHYYQPDEARWLDLMIGYEAWLMLMLEGATDDFYVDLRWPSWRADSATCPLDMGIRLDPAPWDEQGADVSRAVRRREGITEVVARVSAAVT